MVALVGLVLRVLNTHTGFLDVEERDERTSARCSSGAVRELALLDGTTRRDRVRLRVLDQAPRGCWGVLLLDVEERGRDRRAAGRRQAAR